MYLKFIMLQVKNCKIFAVFRLSLIFSCIKLPKVKKYWTIKSKEDREKTYGQSFICPFFKVKNKVLTQKVQLP